MLRKNEYFRCLIRQNLKIPVLDLRYNFSNLLPLKQILIKKKHSECSWRHLGPDTRPLSCCIRYLKKLNFYKNIESMYCCQLLINVSSYSRSTTIRCDDQQDNHVIHKRNKIDIGCAESSNHTCKRREYRQ